VEPPAEPPPVDAGLPPCPRCGTPPEDRFQEYCLECGSRLVRYPAAARTSFFRREAWAGGSPLWMWVPLLALLLLALLLTGVIVWATDEDEPGREARPTTSGSISIVTGPTTFTPPVSTFTATTFPTTAPTFPTTTALTTTTAATTTTTTTTTTPASDIISWPVGEQGYTIVLASVPKRRGRNAADRKANEAVDRGLSEVGVLDSSEYSSLNPGYYVVFTGVYDDQAEATSALPRARSAFPLAYAREIVP
jgi:hypothetical protein